MHIGLVTGNAYRGKSLVNATAEHRRHWKALGLAVGAAALYLRNNYRRRVASQAPDQALILWEELKTLKRTLSEKRRNADIAMFDLESAVEMITEEVKLSQESVLRRQTALESAETAKTEAVKTGRPEDVYATKRDYEVAQGVLETGNKRLQAWQEAERQVGTETLAKAKEMWSRIEALAPTFHKTIDDTENASKTAMYAASHEGLEFAKPERALQALQVMREADVKARQLFAEVSVNCDAIVAESQRLKNLVSATEAQIKAL